MCEIQIGDRVEYPNWKDQTSYVSATVVCKIAANTDPTADLDFYLGDDSRYSRKPIKYDRIILMRDDTRSVVIFPLSPYVVPILRIYPLQESSLT